MDTVKRTRFGFVIVLLTLLVVFGASSSSVQAQSTGTTNIDIVLPQIVVLHYFNKVTLSISSAELATYLNLTEDQGDKATISVTSGGVGTFSANLAINPGDPPGSVTIATLTLQNAWAVRAIGGGNNTQLAISVPLAGNTLTHASVPEAQIGLDGASVTDGANSGVSIQFVSPGMQTPQTGDIALTLDMSAATEAGTYEGGQVTLTASNP
jgi:hypothetical protein